MVPELVVLAEDIPENGAFPDHVFWVGELVEHDAGRSHYFSGKSVELLLQRDFGGSELGV